MGITIAYRGRLADLTRIEDFEDRLLDFALEVGGMAQIWRTYADDNPQRVVRGVILNLTPGQEPASMLVSPEGWLVGLMNIKDAEEGRLTEPPWCFTKTQFGPLEGHVVLVEMLTALQREFLTDLEVSDDSGYWETRDLAELTRRHTFLQKAIEGMAEGLQRHGLSREAAEDPDILVRRIERIAEQVHRVLGRPAEHPPVTSLDDETPSGVPDPAATEALWDKLYKHNRRQQERMQRAIEERRSRGETEEQALDGAMEDLGLGVPDEESEPFDEADNEEQEPFADPLDVEDEPDSGEVAEDVFEQTERERHPLLQTAMDLQHQLHLTFRDADAQFEASLNTLFHGAGDAMGGLAQALSPHFDDEDDLNHYGLCIVQLKRALRGAAFATGALFPLRAAVNKEQFDELHRALRQLEKDIFAELSRRRAAHPRDDS